MDSLIVNFGDPVANFFAQFGVYGIVVAILWIVAKKGIIPAVKEWLANRDNIGNNILTKLDAIHMLIDNMIKKFDEEKETAHYERQTIIQKVDELLGENIGNADIQLALTLFGQALDRIHLRAICFYNVRVRANHIIDNKETIRQRYNFKADELSFKLSDDLGKFYYRKMPLNTYFGPSTAKAYTDTVLKELFDIHYTCATSTKEVDLLDIEKALERNIDRLLVSYNKWLFDQNQTFTQQLADGAEFKMGLI